MTLALAKGKLKQRDICVQMNCVSPEWFVLLLQRGRAQSARLSFVISHYSAITLVSRATLTTRTHPHSFWLWIFLSFSTAFFHVNFSFYCSSHFAKFNAEKRIQTAQINTIKSHLPCLSVIFLPFSIDPPVPSSTLPPTQR